MYTSQGLMTSADFQEYLKDTDQGVTVIDPDAPPEWFDVAGECTVCRQPIKEHESLTVTDASGEIFACVDDDGEPHELPSDWDDLPW